ncbi:MAG: hypothetical protein ACYCVB_19665 [Bacilli bacterium]
MRFEEMTVDDLRKAASFCDTVVFTFGGAAWRPAHLPLGTGWYILRRLRDSLETALGTRLLTLPVHAIDTIADEGALTRVDDGVVEQTAQHALRELSAYLTVRHIVVITDSLYKEELLQKAFTPHQSEQRSLVSFVWWRDGLASSGDVYAPSGDVETSLMLAIGKRLVDVKQKSLQRYGATAATAERGADHLVAITRTLQSMVRHTWESGSPASCPQGAAEDALAENRAEPHSGTTTLP